MKQKAKNCEYEKKKNKNIEQKLNELFLHKTQSKSTGSVMKPVLAFYANYQINCFW